MKKTLAIGLTLLSLNVFSQSFLILQNGVTLTIDKAGFLYDFNHFNLPYKVGLAGGQFFVSDEKLVTIDENGFSYQKDQFKIKKIKGKGLNYIINDSNDLINIDAKGFVYKYDKESSIFKKATAFGGNYFIVNSDERKKIFDLYTVNDKGNYSMISVPGLNPADITSLGGQYFMTNKGVLHTVSKEGFVFSKKESETGFKVGSIVRKGGNFFIDSANFIFTISENGTLVLPILPFNFKSAEIEKIGANYLIDQAGRIFTVDSAGQLHDRGMAQHDLKNVKILSL